MTDCQRVRYLAIGFQIVIRYYTSDYTLGLPPRVGSASTEPCD